MNTPRTLVTSSARPAQARVQSKGGVRSRKPDEHLAALAQTDRPFAQGQDSSKLTSEDQAECVLSTGKRLHERLFGGIRFPDTGVSKWSAFSACRRSACSSSVSIPATCCRR